MNECLFEDGYAPFQLEERLTLQGYTYLAGVDEAGRGALAGPVVAAAVILKGSARALIGRVTDSKKLTAAKREALFAPIHEHSLSVGVGIVPPVDIDRINILQASLLAMKIAVENLQHTPDLCLIDGNMKAPMAVKQMTVVQGDLRVFSISAASIIAKVTRDRIMLELHETYPAYGFKKHMGYGTKEHVQALRDHGFCDMHRKTFQVASLAS